MDKDYGQLSKEELIGKIKDLETKLDKLSEKAPAFPKNEEYLMLNKKIKLVEELASIGQWKFYAGSKELRVTEFLSDILEEDLKNGTIGCETYLKFIHPDDREIMKERFDNPSSKPKDFEYRIVKGGKTKYLYTKIIHSYEENGQAVLDGYVQDITGIVEKRNELENVKYAINKINEEIYAFTTEGSLFFANQQVIDKYRLSGDITNYKISDITPGFNTSNIEELMWQIRENGGTHKRVSEHRLPSGEKQTFEIITYIIKNVTGNDIIWVFARDISLRLQQENRIKELNRMMDSILDNIPVYLFVKDTGDDFRYLYWNKAFEKYSQISAETAIGKTDFDIFPNYDDAVKFRKDDLTLLSTKKNIEYIESYQAKSGDIRTVKTLKTLIWNENKPPLLVGVSLDITDMKKTEQELIEARMKAEQSNKLKSAFLANMSHEIRTPLNAIVGFSRLISETNNLDERIEYYNIVEDNSNTLTRLINDILDLSKIEAGTLDFIDGAVNVRRLCQHAYEIHKVHTQKNVSLIFDDNNLEITTLTDINRLSQVLSNLITNAIKFTTEGHIRFGFIPDKEVIHFYVEDTGTGIAKDKLDSVFKRFVKLNTFAQGTGLGLAISKMIVEKLGGEIKVESEEHKGTTFRFTIPYRPAEDDKSEATDIIQSKRKTGTDMQKTILVAEDVESNFLLLKALIGKSYNLLRAYTGVDAVRLFHEKQPDLILMDIKMPEMDGLEATAEIRKTSTQIPIIALTAFAFNDDRTEALNAGCNDYLTKPVSAELLKQTIEKYI